MRVLVFDTETTGFAPGSICQLSYILADSRTWNAAGRNYFFSVDYVEPGAAAVHGYSVETLRKLSNGQRFGHHSQNILTDFNSHPLWVAHNFSFDQRFISAEFQNVGISIRPQRSFCTMNSFTSFLNKKPKLEELANYFKITPQMISSFAGKVFNTNRLNAHDARYDSAVAYLCFQKAVEDRLIDNV